MVRNINVNFIIKARWEKTRSTGFAVKLGIKVIF